jgi:hypothetical protein
VILKQIKNPGRRLLCIFVLASFTLFFFLLGIKNQVFAQDSEEDFINYSYLTSIGIGGYNVADRDAVAFQIPFSFQLRPMEEDQLGIKLLLPVTVASLESEVTNIGGFVVPKDAQVVGVNPGVELQIPVTQEWTLKPFTRLGFGRDVSGGDGSLIFAIGLKSRYAIPWRKFQFALGTGIFYDAFKPESGDKKDYASVGVGWDTIYPLGFNLWDQEANIGGYFAYYYFFDNLEFIQSSNTYLEINDQYEVGLTLGVYDHISLWFLKLQRFGIAYRFGEDLKAIRLISDFPF